LLLLLLPLSLLPEMAAARGPIYRFVDDRGVIHFTNIPNANQRFQLVPPAPERLPAALQVRVDPPPDHHAFDALIVRKAREHRVEPALVKAVIAAESNFEPRAISRVGAQGLMQLMPKTGRKLGLEEPFEPVQNVEAGARYLRAMLDRYGDLRRALAAYNAGPTAVDRHRGVPPYPETRAYVDRVLTYYRGYHDEFRRSSPAAAGSAGRPARRGGG
jgi:soluble lytic murein transglycosylase